MYAKKQQKQSRKNSASKPEITEDKTQNPEHTTREGGDVRSDTFSVPGFGFSVPSFGETSGSFSSPKVKIPVPVFLCQNETIFKFHSIYTCKV
jgi:hypothetical protein